MSFHEPGQLLWGLLGLAPVLFYFWRSRRRTLEVSAHLLWQRALARRTAWSRWRPRVALGLQLAAVGLLAVALAEPYWRDATGGAQTTVAILDTSASMRATDVSPSRFARAKDNARQLIRELWRGDRLAILSGGSLSRVHCALTNDRGTLDAALADIEPTDGPSRMSHAVELARRLLANEPHPRIVLLTDGAFDGAADLAKAADIEWRVAAGSGRNVGITRFEMRPSLSDPLGHALLVEVTSFAAEPIQCRLLLGDKADPRETIPLTLASREVFHNIYDWPVTQARIITTRLDIADDLAADNEAQVLVPGRSLLSVTLVTPGNPALAQALGSLPFVEMSVVENLPIETDSRGVTVFDRHVPGQMPVGPVLAIDPAESCDLWDVEPMRAGNSLVTTQAASTLMENVDLASAVFEDAVRLKFSQPFQTLAASQSGDPLYSALDRASGRVLVLHVDLQKSDLTLRPAFPLLLANAVRWLGHRNDDMEESLRTSDAVALAPIAQPRIVQSPMGERRPLPAGQAYLGPPDEVGLWAVWTASTGQESKSQRPPEQVLATNLLDARESDLTPVAGIRSTETRALEHSFLDERLWGYFLTAALGLVLLQWFVSERRGAH